MRRNFRVGFLFSGSNKIAGQGGQSVKNDVNQLKKSTLKMTSSSLLLDRLTTNLLYLVVERNERWSKAVKMGMVFFIDFQLVVFSSGQERSKVVKAIFLIYKYLRRYKYYFDHFT
jgi:hypothetical protein